MTKLKIFESPEFGTVRTVTINGEPWLGEYVNLGTAAKIMGVSRPTVDKLRQEGALEFVPRVGVPVRSIAALPETVRAMALAPSPSVRRTAQRVADFVRIEP